MIGPLGEEASVGFAGIGEGFTHGRAQRIGGSPAAVADFRCTLDARLSYESHCGVAALPGVSIEWNATAACLAAMKA